MTDASLPQPKFDTVPVWWRAVVEAHGEAEMIRMAGASSSFNQIDQRSSDLARGLLAQGVGKGARIGLLAPNGPEWLIAWLAINRIGAIAVGLSTFYSSRELRYAVRYADICLLITASSYLSHDYIERLEDTFPELSHASAKPGLALEDAPFLRSVWVVQPTSRTWVAGTIEELATLGRACARFTPVLLEAVEAAVSPADLGLIIYTSGSTADPKGVVHTQGATVRKILLMAEMNAIIPYDLKPQDRMLVTSPFFWVGGFLSLTAGATHGVVIVCQDDHSPQALLECLRTEGLTQITGSESVLRLMEGAQSPGSNAMATLRCQNTAQLPYFLRRQGIVPERHANVIGMTETFGPHSGFDDLQSLPAGAEGSLGPPLAGVEYRIRDQETKQPVAFGQPGELWLRAPWLMDGMYNRERHEVFDADGFYATGDGCILREDGFLFFRSRLSGMIKTSGANVAPDEVERLICEDPRVAEAAVLGVPDEQLGQMVVAVIVPASGASMTESEVRTSLRKQLSSFKTPKRVFFLAHDEVPRTLSNKIRKPQLTELIVGRLAAEVRSGGLRR